LPGHLFIMGTNTIILGIDPGTNIMGYGLIKTGEKEPVLIGFGCVEMQQFHDYYEKLRCIFDRTLQLVDEYKPVALAIESQFYGNNVQSMLKLGRAQGAAIAAALYRSVPVFEYAPRKIKQAITGYGNASKEQIAAFLQKLMKFDTLPDKLDATDGLAVALCHFYQQGKISSSGKYKGWDDFIRKNPERMA
jgi:crossover junction endodeoxyribonuclease RuvC